MFLEKVGKFFFYQMRPLFFFILAAFPILGAAFFLYLEYDKLQDLEERFTRAARKEKLAFERKERKERFLERYSQADPYFLDQQIESLSLLQKEKQNLTSLLDHPAFPYAQALRDRLAFLETNRLSFTEETIQASSEIKETGEKLRASVQMDEEDLQKILALLEDVPVGPYLPLPHTPQIVIKDFRLKKHETSLQTQVFDVEMDLLKREFIK